MVTGPGSGSVGATFQLAAKFGAGRSGGIPKAIFDLADIGGKAGAATHT